MTNAARKDQELRLAVVRQEVSRINRRIAALRGEIDELEHRKALFEKRLEAGTMNIDE